MRFVALLAIGASAGVAVQACGSQSASAPEDSAPVTSGCQGDADCPLGQVCRSIRVGESEERSCVVDGLHGEAGAPSSSTPAPTATAPPAPPDAGLDGAVEAGNGNDDAGDASVVQVDAGGTSDAGGPCRSSLTVTITKRTTFGNCLYNTTVEASSPAVLDYPCAGGGAQVTFGAQTFTGTFAGGIVDVVNVDTYSYKVPDTGTICSYTSTQTIDGTLTSGTLQYDYTEKLVDKSSLACKLLTAACAESGPVAATAP
jgi:hypothetical protein